MPNTIPNFDAMTEEALLLFWYHHPRGDKEAAARLIGDRRKGYVTLTVKLAKYASHKARAMRARRLGKILVAVAHESIYERIYQELPDDLKW